MTREPEPVRKEPDKADAGHRYYRPIILRQPIVKADNDDADNHEEYKFEDPVSDA
jgi:hypothetical protein